MTENPYAPPATSRQALPGQRTRFRFGSLVFLGLGSMFVLLPTWAVLSTINDPRFQWGVGYVASLIIAVELLMIALGLLLIAHGVLRSNTTIGLASCFLLAIIALVVAAAIVLF